MCEECKRRFIAQVVQENTDQAYRGYVDGRFDSPEEAATSLVNYAAVQYDYLHLAIGDLHGTADTKDQWEGADDDSAWN
jgi:hypothetical protein